MGLYANWKEALADHTEPTLAGEIDAFEAQVLLRKQGKIDEKLFAETRLRRGVYGQRYDNGRRHDGVAVQELSYPNNPLTKGAETLWDAPGMMRVKIPCGGLNPAQMDVLADLAEEYSDGICHVTTRQDIQYHYVHIEDTPDLMRRLAAVGITTREACGNSVRNVTACPFAGVCNDEVFDVTPYAQAVARYLLGHPDTQGFGRKFKIAFSGCKASPCALISIHDLGGIAAKRVVDGQEQRGFELYVGGGLGAVPHQAKLLAEFVPQEQLLPMARAIGRVFAKLGEKKNRQKARLKFLVAKLGIDEFRKLVLEEMRSMPEDGLWRQYFDAIAAYSENSVNPPTQLAPSAPRPPGYAEWAATNVYPQRQKGYAVVTISCPLGDLTARQMRALGLLADRFAGGNVRTTIEQNIVLRWVSLADLPGLYRRLNDLGLGEGGAGTIVDVTSCPGTETCKLGISSSRGLARELRRRLAAQSVALDQSIRSLRIKISGCFNSCGQHHVADIGFYGNSRNVGGYTVPHFQVVLGGQWRQNGGAYGLAIGAVPSKAIPQVVDRIIEHYLAGRSGTQTFQDYCQRIGKKELKAMLEDLAAVPLHAVNPDFYSDWGDPRAYTLGDMAAGEGAGNVISPVDFGFRDAESAAFEAQLLLEKGQYEKADHKAYQAMLTAARTLVRMGLPDLPDDPETIVRQFRLRLVEPKLFWDKYHAGQFANYLLSRHEGPDTRYTQQTAQQLVAEAELFVDAAHKCHAGLLALQAAAGAASASPNIPNTQAQ